jgi:hypothetical protein
MSDIVTATAADGGSSSESVPAVVVLHYSGNVVELGPTIYADCSHPSGLFARTIGLQSERDSK